MNSWKLKAGVLAISLGVGICASAQTTMGTGNATSSGTTGSTSVPSTAPGLDTAPGVDRATGLDTAPGLNNQCAGLLGTARAICLHDLDSGNGYGMSNRNPNLNPNNPAGTSLNGGTTGSGTTGSGTTGGID